MAQRLNPFAVAPLKRLQLQRRLVSAGRERPLRVKSFDERGLAGPANSREQRRPDMAHVESRAQSCFHGEHPEHRDDLP